MKYQNTSCNSDLNLLMRTLKSLGINCINPTEESLEIFFNDNQQELVLNMLSQIDTCKSGFVFRVRKSGDQKIKSATVKFKRNMNISCGLLTNYLNADFHKYNLNTFNKIDLILDSFNYDDITLSIQKNMDIENEFLITLSQKMTKEQLENKENIIFDNEELYPRLIHTICTQNQDGTYSVTYGLLYNNEIPSLMY